MPFQRRKKYRSYSNFRGAVKRAKGNFKSAKTNKDRATFTINVSQPFVLSGDVISVVDSAGVGHNIQLGVQALNIWDILARSDNFQSFSKMFDQVTLDYVDVNLQVTNSTINTNEANTTYDLYTAWDRTGVSRAELWPKVETKGGVQVYTGTYMSLGKAITKYNYQKTQLNAFQRWKQHKCISPSSLSEKSQIVQTGTIEQWHRPFNTTDLYYPMFTDLTEQQWLETNYLNENPACLAENPSYPWKPTLLVGAFRSGVSTVDGETVAQSDIPLSKSTKIVMTADIKCVCTFRGQKGAQQLV